ncbi:MAG: hypothetical protein AB1393_11405 [Candidatus Edwardsbacteria bacterium]
MKKLKLLSFYIFTLFIFVSSAGAARKGNSCNRLRKLSDKEKIQIVLSELQHSAQHQERERFLIHFSKDYSDAQNKGPQSLKSKAEHFFSKYQPRENRPFVYLYDPEIKIDGKNAVVNCKVLVDACRTDNGEAFMRVTKEKIKFIKEGEYWKIIGTERLLTVLGEEE